MSAPLRTQAGAVKVYLKFVEFLAGRVIALQERLGPNTTTVPLESEPGQSISPTRRCSSSPLPARKPSRPPKRGSPVPSKHGSPTASRHGSPPRTDLGKRPSAPTGVGENVFSPESQSTFKLWADLNLSDVDDTFTDEEGQDRHQTPLPVPGKRSHLSSDDKKSPSKKAKLVSNLYGAPPGTSAQGVGITGKDEGTTGKGDGSAGEGDEDSESKAPKHKKSKKSKKKRSKKSKKDTDKKDNKKDKKKPTGGDEATPEKKKTPEKTGRNPSGDENSETPSKSKKKPIRTVQECRRDKWVSDSPLAIRYRQC